MSFNGSGVFNLAESPFVFDTVISETEMNSNLSDIATGLSNCMTKDGQQTITANIPMSSKKFTGLAVGSAQADSATLRQIQAGAFRRAGTAGGTKNALTIAPSPAIAAYALGQRFTVTIGGTSSDAATTIAVSGLATKAVEINGAALDATTVLVTAKTYDMEYDGTAFQATRLSVSAVVEGSNPNFTTVELGHASDTTLSRAGAGDMNIEGNIAYRAGGTDVPVADGGSGAGTAAGARSNFGVQAATVLDTEQATTSGSAVTFGSIPSGTKEISMLLAGVSADGTGAITVQLGDAGGIETSGYVGMMGSIIGGVANQIAMSAGHLVASPAVPGRTYGGVITFKLEDAANNTWSWTGASSGAANETFFGSGVKTLTAELTQITIITADTFDAGAVNIQYSGAV